MEKILLIEDEQTGKSFRELLLKSIEDIDVIWVKNRDQALSQFKKDWFHVVVYDQRLENNELGTDILLELKMIDENIQAIMLSAYATPTDTTLASKERILFDFCDKDKIEKLPAMVIDALRYYNLNKALKIEHEKKFIGKSVSIKNLFHPVKYYIVLEVLLDAEYVDSWKTIYIINAGEKLSKKRAIEITSEIKIIDSTKNETNGSISIDKLHKLINSNFETKTNFFNETTIQENQKWIDEEMRTYELPPIPQSVTEDYLTATMVETGQIFEKYDIEVLQECSLCKSKSFHHFTVFVPTHRQKFRKTNTYRFRNQEIIEISPKT